jgi:hypothetical protein
MTLPTVPELPQLWPLMLALAAAGTVGFRRGWVREVATLGLLLFSWVVVVALGFSVVASVNKLALMLSFTWQGGFDAADPAALLRALRPAPAIDPWHPEWFYALLFALGVVGAYVVPSQLAARGESALDALLGGLAGALNGYVVAYVLLGYLQAGGRGGPIVDGLSPLGGYAPTIVVAVVAGAVGIAMLTSLRGAVFGQKR